MDQRDFDKFLARLRRQLAKCSRQQVAAAHETVASHAARWLCLEMIEAFGRSRTVCPHCPGRRFHRHGHAAGLQRYRCVDCGRTFNALTHTPLASLRCRERWLPYLQCMLDSRTVRSAATQAGIHRNTSFRWRHRFLMRTKHDRPGILQGVVEADETYLLESQKGSRHLNRPARRRGGVADTRGITRQHVCILVARDRGGATRDWMTGRGPVTQALLHICLPPVVAPDAILVSDGARAYRGFAAACAIAHEALNLRAGRRSRGPFHLQNVNGYHSRFRNWLGRFLGVASHYLPNYLGWRHALEGRRIVAPVDLLRSALGARRAG